MAGKLHAHWRYSVRYPGFEDGTGHGINLRQARAYAEGYQHHRKYHIWYSTANPFPVSTDPESEYVAWNSGWTDSEAYFEPTHVGLPRNTSQAVPPGGEEEAAPIV